MTASGSCWHEQQPTVQCREGLLLSWMLITCMFGRVINAVLLWGGVGSLVGHGSQLMSLKGSSCPLLLHEHTRDQGTGLVILGWSAAATRAATFASIVNEPYWLDNRWSSFIEGQNNFATGPLWMTVYVIIEFCPFWRSICMYHR